MIGANHADEAKADVHDAHLKENPDPCRSVPQYG
jgi:hypothetical protein